VIAANILNRGYFSGVDLDRAIGNLVAALSSGGRLVLIDNRATSGGFDESERATIFRSSDGALEIEHRIGAGSEVEDLVPRQVTALSAEGAA
jgi:hypothetical protein